MQNLKMNIISILNTHWFRSRKLTDSIKLLLDKLLWELEIIGWGEPQGEPPNKTQGFLLRQGDQDSIQEGLGGFSVCMSLHEVLLWSVLQLTGLQDAPLLLSRSLGWFVDAVALSLVLAEHHCLFDNGAQHWHCSWISGRLPRNRDSLADDQVLEHWHIYVRQEKVCICRKMVWPSLAFSWPPWLPQEKLWNSGEKEED